jgi:hypothetical protein
MNEYSPSFFASMIRLCQEGSKIQLTANESPTETLEPAGLQIF